MPVDWKLVQDALFDLASGAVRRFAPEPDEVFYGFAFDINPDYGGVLLCLNTVGDFEDTKVRYAGESAERLESIRWNTGDWRYQGFEDEKFAAGWDPFESQINDESVEQFSKEPCSTFEMMLGSACLVMLRMERSGAFDDLNCTADFKTCVCGSDEGVEKGWTRFNAIRNAKSDPLPYEEATRFAELYHHGASLQGPIKRERQSLPETLCRRFLQRAHELPFRPVGKGEWIVYSLEDEFVLWDGDTRHLTRKPFEVRYREADRTYHLTIGDSPPLACGHTRELVSLLEQHLPVELLP